LRRDRRVYEIAEKRSRPKVRRGPHRCCLGTTGHAAARKATPLRGCRLRKSLRSHKLGDLCAKAEPGSHTIDGKGRKARPRGCGGTCHPTPETPHFLLGRLFPRRRVQGRISKESWFKHGFAPMTGTDHANRKPIAQRQIASLNARQTVTPGRAVENTESPDLCAYTSPSKD
jgi:hypothetical protein